MQLPSALASPSPKRIKKIHLEKNSLYFRKWNFLALILKNSYIFSKESFSYISGNEAKYFSAQAREIKKIHPEKNFYTSGNGNPERTPYIFGNGAFLYFGKWKF